MEEKKNEKKDFFVFMSTKSFFAMNHQTMDKSIFIGC